MTEQYKKGVFIMDFLEDLGMNMLTIGTTIDNEHLEKSYQLIKNNPQISKAEFLEKMGLIEEED